MVGLMPHDSKAPSSPASPNTQSNRNHAMGVMVRTFQIKNQKQRRRLFWLTGAAFTGAAAGFYAWGVRRQRLQRIEANRLFDLEADRWVTSDSPQVSFGAHYQEQNR
jgi:hypothetical protein